MNVSGTFWILHYPKQLKITKFFKGCLWLRQQVPMINRLGSSVPFKRTCWIVGLWTYRKQIHFFMVTWKPVGCCKDLWNCGNLDVYTYVTWNLTGGVWGDFVQRTVGMWKWMCKCIHTTCVLGLVSPRKVTGICMI